MDDFIQPKIKSFKNTDPKDGDDPIIDGIVEPKIENIDFVPEPVPTQEVETIDLDMDDKNPKEEEPIMTKRSRFKLTKKKAIIIGLATLAVVALAFLIYWFFIKSDKQEPEYKPNTVTKKIEEKKVYSPLTGVLLSDPALAKRPVTGIMIENSPDARPQSGLNEAGVVLEAVAEGGITRFLAFYQESTPQYIGPVRSARSYYVTFALTFDASYAHVGGSPESLNDIRSLGAKDLDQFQNAGSYWRISERYAPHNMYTSFERLDKLNTAKGYTSSKFTPFERKIDVPQTPTASNINLIMSGPLYNPNFKYDQASNSYKRAQGGGAHVDQKSGAQINPKVIVALVMNKSLMRDGSHNSYTETGSGKVYVFQDGIVSEGTWNRADRKSALTLTDKNGLPMKLNAGQTWITLVGGAGDVVYQP